MTKKELKKLAKEIASCERIIQTTQDSNEKAAAQDKVIRLADKVYGMEDMLALDCLIQEFLSQPS